MQKQSIRILLLNPPGAKMYFRDYYCAKVSKARYYYHPIDLVYLSGRLSEIAQVFVIDAIAERMTSENCLKEIIEKQANIIIFLSSAPSYTEDIAFISNIKKQCPNTKMIGTGDIFRELKTKALVDNNFLNAILLDFSTSDIVTFIKNTDEIAIPNIIYRFEEKIIDGKEQHGKGNFEFALPRWDLFNLKTYNFPFARHKPFASILTDFGCPYSCDFCPISTLGFKLRSIEAVMDEMHYLKNLGIKELYVRDQTFGANKTRTKNLLLSMIEANFKFTWTCLSRTDVVDLEMLTLMKKAGCHTIMIGIESASNDLMKNHKKNTQIHQTHQAIYNIKKARIKISGFFMIGFPDESKESILATAKLARSLPLDFASFNIASPRFGTKFRENAISKNQVDPEVLNTESSNALPIWKNSKVSNQELLILKQKAVKQFYLRPGYLIKRIFKIKSLVELQNTIHEAISMLRKNQ
jgi:radical SAM superfamily enzyme YgiQ (UPF0313 family)